RLPAHRGILISLGGLSFLFPFLQAGWGGILMVAGIVGGNVAGFVSDLFFGSRRAPAAGGLYAVLFLCTIAMGFSLGQATSVLAASQVPELQPGDRILSIAGKSVNDWVSARRAFACAPASCASGAGWDGERCACSSSAPSSSSGPLTEAPTLPVTVERAGKILDLALRDPAYKASKDGTFAPAMRAGDSRELKASPSLTLSPYVLGTVVFLISLCVIGTHGLLSGTATMDFGGKKGAATAVAMIDGFVYLGTALQSFALGKITSHDWSYWPWFLAPFALLGFLLSLRIWHAHPSRASVH
ncbi:MAG: hypothetical protein RMJ98_13645, partial [Myxococcales bacterium]|nr:hypothetical protein [Polyangiaceae bacterium]MDW8250334.1 hypothetical protein [Myxococcales bacterium]